MPPIKLYTNSPINAAKAEGVTPKTAAPSNNDDANQESDQAGRRPSNTPVQNQLHAPLQPTPTRPHGMENNNNNPPPPQPGAAPYPRPTQTGGGGHYAPPAPAPTQAAQLPGVIAGGGDGGGGNRSYPTYPPPPPHQMGMSLVESTAPQTYRGTSTATFPTPTAAVPSTGMVGYATAGNYPGVGGAGVYQQRDNANDSYRDDGEDEHGIWNSAVKWAQAAGEKLSEAESEVWRRINKE